MSNFTGLLLYKTDIGKSQGGFGSGLYFSRERPFAKRSREHAFISSFFEWSVFSPQKVTLLDTINTTVKLLMITFQKSSYLLFQLVSSLPYTYTLSFKTDDYSFPLEGFHIFRHFRHIPFHWLARGPCQLTGGGKSDANFLWWY